MAKAKPKRKPKAARSKVAKTTRRIARAANGPKQIAAPMVDDQPILTKAPPNPQPPFYHRPVVVAAMGVVFGLSLWGLFHQLATHPAYPSLALVPPPVSVVEQANALPAKIQAFEAQEKASERTLVPDSQLTTTYTTI